MSESVKIGGIGKNPAIDKINSLNTIDIKNYAAGKMNQIILSGRPGGGIAHVRDIPVSFEQVDWEGKSSDGVQRTSRMAGSKLSGGQDTAKTSGKLYEAVGRSVNGEVSRQSQTAGNIYQSGRKQDYYIQLAGQAFTGDAGISGNKGDAETD